MGRRSLSAVAVLAACALAAGAQTMPPASARPAPSEGARAGITHVTARPTDGHFDSSIDVSIPGGGSELVSSPTVPTKLKEAEVDVFAASTDSAFGQLALMLAQLPTPGSRVAACLTVTAKALNFVDADAAFSANSSQEYAAEPSLALVTVYFCLKVALLVAAVLASGDARQRTGGCPVAPLAVKTHLQKSGHNYVLTPAGGLLSKKKYSRLKVKCTVIPNGYALHITPRKRGATLRSVVGSRLTIGLASPSGAPTVPVTVRFKS
jgi:hypothetical protein